MFRFLVFRTALVRERDSSPVCVNRGPDAAFACERIGKIDMELS